MRLTSPLPPEEYIDAMKEQMGSRWDFGSERFTGFFLGNVFNVTFHSGYEFDRRYNNPKNSALGFVVKREQGCEVRFVRLKGLLNPPTFFLYALICTLILLLVVLSEGLMTPPFGEELLYCIGIGFGVAAFAALASAFWEGFSQRSAEGARTLVSFLLNPKDPYFNY